MPEIRFKLSKREQERISDSCRVLGLMKKTDFVRIAINRYIEIVQDLGKKRWRIWKL